MIYIDIYLQVREDEIKPNRAVKELGILLDQKHTFWQHIRNAADKAATQTVALARLMANIGGSKQGKRRLLMTTTMSTMLYETEIWADALKVKKYRNRIAGVQRLRALRVIIFYRTVTEAGHCRYDSN
ncbi:uncharacterized protein LOC127280361 [Leptopilina boulardi]|uniref:uncharacterized protein LOC127280361 n=1 Tax=Leptopilina boulardi TaxID=63433 RepID=UPI0021F63A4A|nr:uncharacterized protein LOC127280361 [Leptopilina boulardi]